ncbi:hypothetical protein RB195_007112 [Necator americanus]|uniref:C2H2-type domain-containing protein n=1 Tax=Necator americanus TaxID=51031 RepID=A0ABR1BVN2_NECAM
MDTTHNIAMNECPVCGVAKKRMERHLVDVHGYSQDQIADFKVQKKSRKVAASGKPVYNCEFCDATFNSMSGLSRHRGTKHADEYSPRVIMCPICRESVKSHRELANHAHQEHAEDPDEFVVETIVFQNLEDYENWKLSLEKGGVISRFIARTKITEHTKVTYLRCHFSFHSASVAEKTKKSVPYCTAYMNVTEKVDGVTVEHCPTHLGHEARPSHKMPCPR